MSPHPRSLSPAPRCALSLVLAAALLAPASALAARKSFSAGSLIIPASIEYQSNNGLIASYALVYSVLYLNAQRARPIRLYWAIAPNKLSPYRCDTMHTDPGAASNAHPEAWYSSYSDNDGCDFYIERAAVDGGRPVSLIDQNGDPVNDFLVNDIVYDDQLGPQRASTTHAVDSSTQMVKYLGGSWIVDSTDADAFLTLLEDASQPGLWQFHKSGTAANPNNATATSLYVNIHVANHDFIAPVAGVLTQQPPLVAIVGSSGQTAKLTDVLVNAGLCGSSGFFVDGGTPQCPGTVYDDFTSDPTTLLGTSTSAGTLNNNVAANGPVYGLLWLADGAFGNNPSCPAAIPSPERATIEAFLGNKGNVFAEYNTIGAMECGHYHSTAGVTSVTHSGVPPNEDCNDSSSLAFFSGGGGSCIIYRGANLPFAQAGNFYYQQGGNGNYEGYAGTFRFPPATTPGTIPVVQEGPTPGNMIASASYYQNDTSKGVIMYLAGHKYDNPPKYWGERLIMNTIFARLAAPTGTELSRSEPVAYVNTNTSPSTTRIYQGTYVEQLLPDVTAMVTYDATDPTMWQFPYTQGHLYEYDLADLSTTAEAFGSATRRFDAGALLSGGVPMPASRQIWTFVPGSSGRASGNVGWKRIDLKYTEVTSGCSHGSDGKCHLAKALLASGNAAGIQLSALQAPADDPAQAKALGMLVSQIRGSCAAHDAVGDPIYAPSDGQCDPRTSTDSTLPTLNRARLGGIDHGSPAVVGPSRYVADAPWSTRPVVAYAAGHDGMLHAFYVSDWDGGTGGSWPGGSAANVANFALLGGATPGRELWAIAPPGQVGLMFSNDALVDGSINVVDVFGNFPHDRNGDGVFDWSMANCPGADGGANCERPNGIRSWRTVLIATAGKGSSQWGIGGSEIFALDVTNPLDPALLWHVGGATENDKRWYDPTSDSWGPFDAGGVPGDPTRFALEWSDSYSTNYNPVDAAIIDALKTSRYDFGRMGLAYSTAVAKVWSGGGYEYALFVTTNAADFAPTDASSLFSNAWYTPAQAPGGGLRGAEVFAMDLVTGQKLWQWEHLYSSTVGMGVDNSVPPRMALGDIDANGSTDRIYVGDLEGRLWELSARDGRNWNYLLGNDGQRYSLPLFGTTPMTGAGPPVADPSITTAFRVNDGTTALSQQPLTTPIGQGRFTVVPSDQSGFLANRLAVLVGTMGVDWPIAPFETGHIYVIPVSPDMGTRFTEPIDMSATRDPRKFGILLGLPSQPASAWWDIPLGVGERVYGMPRVVNNQIVFNTAFGSFSGDISETLSDPGRFWSVVASASTGEAVATTVANDSKSFAGAVVVGTSVVISTGDKIKKVDGQVTPGDMNTSPFNRATPASPKSWERLEVPSP